MLTAFERALAALSPGLAVRRAQGRLRLRALQEAAAYFDGADRGRRGSSIRRSNAAPDAISRRTLPSLRAGSRDLIRNNPYARRGVESITSNMVGTGITPRFVRNSRPVSRLETLARRVLDTTMFDFMGQLDYYGLTALASDTIVQSGEVIVLRRWVKGGPFPFKIHVLEPDHLDMLKDGPTKSGGRIVQGVEFDASGVIKQYWLFPQHPGDTSRPGSLDSQPFPARDVLHVYRIDRPGQMRGVPWLAPVMLRAADFDDYEHAQLVRQKIAACFAVFYLDQFGIQQANAKNEEVRIEPGMIQRLHGTDVKFAQPPQVTGYRDYAKVSLRAIAAGLGITYEAISFDMEGVNFTSGRMGRLEMERNVDRWRWHMLIPGFCEGVCRWFLEGAALTGANIRNVSVRHAPPAKEMISPEREIPALAEARRTGQITLTEIAAARGRDVIELLDEYAEDQRLLDERGIILTSDARYEHSQAPTPEPDDDDPPQRTAQEGDEE